MTYFGLEIGFDSSLYSKLEHHLTHPGNKSFSQLHVLGIQIEIAQLMAIVIVHDACRKYIEDDSLHEYRDIAINLLSACNNILSSEDPSIVDVVEILNRDRDNLLSFFEFKDNIDFVLALCGSGSRWAKIAVSLGIFSSILSIGNNSAATLEKILADNQPRIEEVYHDCTSAFDIRTVPLEHANTAYRDACIQELRNSMALHDGGEVEKARLQRNLAFVLEDEDPNLSDGKWGPHSDNALELYRKLKDLTGSPLSVVFEHLAEDVYEKALSDRRSFRIR